MEGQHGWLAGFRNCATASGRRLQNRERFVRVPRRARSRGHGYDTVLASFFLPPVQTLPVISTSNLKFSQSLIRRRPPPKARANERTRARDCAFDPRRSPSRPSVLGSPSLPSQPPGPLRYNRSLTEIIHPTSRPPKQGAIFGIFPQTKKLFQDSNFGANRCEAHRGGLRGVRQRRARSGSGSAREEEKGEVGAAWLGSGR